MTSIETRVHSAQCPCREKSFIAISTQSTCLLVCAGGNTGTRYNLSNHIKLINPN